MLWRFVWCLTEQASDLVHIRTVPQLAKLCQILKIIILDSNWLAFFTSRRQAPIWFGYIKNEKPQRYPIWFLLMYVDFASQLDDAKCLSSCEGCSEIHLCTWIFNTLEVIRSCKTSLRVTFTSRLFLFHWTRRWSLNSTHHRYLPSGQFYFEWVWTSK